MPLALNCAAAIGTLVVGGSVTYACSLVNVTSDFTNVAKALQWVLDNHSQYHISVVNLSISDGNNYGQNWFADHGGVGQQITQLIQQLETLNIPVVAATGNSFNGQQGQGFASIAFGSLPLNN